MKDETKTGLEIGRRKFIKASTAAGAAAAVGPWIISSEVLASSGEINVLMWSDYLSAGFFSIARWTAWAIPFVILGRPRETGSGAAARCCLRTSSALSPGKGGWPVNIS